jgi:hypothetical protein
LCLLLCSQLRLLLRPQLCLLLCSQLRLLLGPLLCLLLVSLLRLNLLLLLAALLQPRLSSLWLHSLRCLLPRGASLRKQKPSGRRIQSHECFNSRLEFQRIG